LDHIDIVEIEMRRLETEINHIMTTEDIASQEELSDKVSSDILDVAVVVNDVRRYAD